MPLYRDFEFFPNLFFRNNHFNTLYRYFKTNVKITYKRQRLTTSDNDFIDLDISSVGSNNVIIALHGLEGSSNSSYIQSLTIKANEQNYDVIAVNLRGCSGESNNVLGSYHSGKTNDLHEIIHYIENNYLYERLYIVGYSLGGNITIKYMGEYATRLSAKIKAAIAVSAPCDLKASAQMLAKKSNSLYQANFLKTLKVKAKEKLKYFPDNKLNKTKILNAKTFQEFDNYFTAPVHGFQDADDYWKKSSSKQFIKYIDKPVLLISALDDPFLSSSCYPSKEAKVSEHFYLLAPKYGGHVGFYTHFNQKKNYWLEKTILNFIANSINS
jgi:predicted alpha/beta-fold hydrolase